MPYLLPIVSTTIAADDPGSENTAAAVASSDGFPLSRFSLYLVRRWRRDDGAVIDFHIKLRRFSRIYLVLLCQKNHSEGFCSSASPLYFSLVRIIFIPDTPSNETAVSKRPYRRSIRVGEK